MLLMRGWGSRTEPADASQASWLSHFMENAPSGPTVLRTVRLARDVCPVMDEVCWSITAQLRGVTHSRCKGLQRRCKGTSKAQALRVGQHWVSFADADGGRRMFLLLLKDPWLYDFMYFMSHLYSFMRYPPPPPKIRVRMLVGLSPFTFLPQRVICFFKV